MGIIVDHRARSFLARTAAKIGLLLFCCSLIACSDDEAIPVVMPFEGASVTAAIEGNTLVVTNHSDDVVYHRIFPADILPVIEWAPCIAPETCPSELRIDPGEEKQTALGSIVREGTESIAVFWWIYLEKAPGASVPPMEMHEMSVPLP
jgi:hypothetical protein